jgi:hypothetical protein
MEVPFTQDFFWPKWEIYWKRIWTIFLFKTLWRMVVYRNV